MKTGHLLELGVLGASNFLTKWEVAKDQRRRAASLWGSLSHSNVEHT